MITTINQQSAKGNHRQLNLNHEYETVYEKLSCFIDQVNEKIVNRIQLVQQIYLDDYKEQVAIISNQLKRIKASMDEKLLKERANQRLFFLQEERDFFRAQVIKLNEDLGRLNVENIQLKAKNGQKDEQIKSYRKIAYDLQTKLFKIKNQPIQNNNFKQDIRQYAKQPLLSLDSREERYKDVIRSMNKTTQRMKPTYSLKKLSKPMFLEDEYSQRKQIIDECIKQVKKQIYYRNLNLQQTTRIHFNESNKISFNKFTKTDKKQLIFKILSNPQILQNFYDFLFAKKTNLQNSTNSNNPQKTQRLTKLLDSKFNTRTLMNIKSQFNKKIYDIKSN